MLQNTIPLFVHGEDKAALIAAAQQMLEKIEATPEALQLPQILESVGQRPGKHRAGVLANNREGYIRGLTAIAKARWSKNVVIGQDDVAAKPVLVFPGLGLTWAGMTSTLLKSVPTYRAKLQHCSDRFAPLLGCDLVEDLLACQPCAALQRIQPLLFSIPVALADVWRAFGVEEAATIGHSVGEIAAAHVSGGLTINNAVQLIGLWMRTLGPIEGQGGMISVSASAERIIPLLEPWKDRLFIGAFNSPESVTVCGEASAVEALTPLLEQHGIWAWRIPGGVVAGHTPLVEFLRAPIEKDAPNAPGGSCRSAFYSAVSARRLSEAELTAAYWFSTLREPVRFDQAVRALVEDGHRLFIEVSANPVLTPAIQQVLRSMNVTGAAVATLDSRLDDKDSLLQAFAHAYVNGAPIRWRDALALVLPPERMGDIGAGAPISTPSPAATPSVAASGSAGDWIDVGMLARSPAPEQTKQLLALIAHQTEAVLGHRYPSDSVKFLDIGFTSITLVELAEALSAAIGHTLSPANIFSHPSPLALAEHLRAELGLADAATAASGQTLASSAHDDEPIAIIGMACRYPGGIETPEALWQLLVDGRDAIGEFPADRDWDISALYDPIPGRLGKIYQREGGFVAEASAFDAEFFGISPREALSMEPQQRLMLEIAWEALERAGIDPSSLHGSNTGVFAGIMAQEYGPPLEHATQALSGYRYMGNAACVVSGRIAYVLGLNGPTLSVDTACSSSLTAIHLACEALRTGQCDLALAGGATIMSTPGVLIDFSHLQALAPDGRCKAFSASADGVGLAEGAGMIVLQRLSSAQRAQREILAVICASAVNQDGASNGLSAPNGLAQQHVIRHALARGGWAPQDVDALDAHGTGTRLGDPIEAEAILATYGQDRHPDAPLFLGSIKSNLGHTQAAAGVASVIKMTLAMRHGVLPKSLHITQPTSTVDWSKGHVALLEQQQAWVKREGRPRRAAISSFGVSGTNSHLLLEEAPVLAPAPMCAAPSAHIVLPLSARSPAALQQQAQRLHAHILANDKLDLSAAGLTLGTARARFAHRAAVWGTEPKPILDALEAIAQGSDHPAAVCSSNSSAKLVFVFPGQGAQWPGMGMALYDAYPAFRAALDAADAALAPYTGWSVCAVLRGEHGAPPLERPDVVQPALFAVSVAIARLWQSLGIMPEAIVGHSSGEITAAYIAGALSLDHAAKLTAIRAKLLTDAPIAGAMASIGLSEPRTQDMIAQVGGNIHIAVINSPRATVVCGSDADIERLIAVCEGAQIYAKKIAVDIKAHSPDLRPLRPTLCEMVGEITPQPGNVPFFSTVDGYAADQPLCEDALGIAYWCDNLCQPVRFSKTIAHLVKDSRVTFLECSPHPILLHAIEETANHLNAEAGVIATLKRTNPSADAIAEALAHLTVLGHVPDWRAVYPQATQVDLPTYPFERHSYWLAARPSSDVAFAGLRAIDHAFLSAGIDLPDDGGMILSGRISLPAQPWLADHSIDGAIVLPASVYIDMLLEAAAAVDRFSLQDVTLQAPLVIARDAALDLQLRIHGRSENGSWPVSVYARNAASNGSDATNWQLHATAVVSSAPAPALPAYAGAWPPPEAIEQDVTDLRRRLAIAGYDNAMVCRGLTRLWRDGAAIYAEVALPDGLTPEHHHIHPVLLDAVLQPSALAGNTADLEPLRAPYAIAGIVNAGEAQTRLRICASFDDNHQVSIRTFDDNGHPIAAITAISLRAAPRQALRHERPGQPEHDLLALTWTALPQQAAIENGQSVLDNTVLLEPDGRLFAAFPTLPARPSFAALEQASITPARIIWPVPESTDLERAPAARHLCAQVLQLLQTFAASTKLSQTTLVVLTRNAVATGINDCPDPVHSAAWAMIHSAQNETPDRIVLIDTDDRSDLDKMLAAALASGRAQIAIRNNTLHDPRLSRIAAIPVLSPPGGDSGWRLDLVDGEGIGALKLVADDRAFAPLQPHQIRIDVRAAGLNFYDVAYAMGLISKRHELGAEASGVIVEIGSDVTNFSVGDRVVVIAEGCFGPHLIADAQMASRFPAHWSFAEAAGVPIAFVTAYYALVELAKIKPGDRLLVHAGAGGVGQAAIQLGRHFGAEVFVTASPQKWATLKALGIAVDHIANSREAGFADRFKPVMGGHGIDVAINCLSGDVADETFTIMADGGRFVEIGQADGRDASAISAAHPDLRYHRLDWSVTSDLGRTQRCFAATMRLLMEQTLAPLPLVAFDIQQASDAFGMMQLARHTGKIVLTMPQRINPDGTVLITGGTGTLGALLAEHLVTVHGARHLLLVSRSGSSSPDAASIEAMLTARGAQVTVRACDVSDRNAVAQLLAEIPTAHPLTAIFHTAGVLADSTIPNMTADQIGHVFAPKIDAAWILHQLTKSADLAAFVLYSSINGVLGNPGQANYAAANVFLDSLAMVRRRCGLPATSLGWGWWRPVSNLSRNLRAADTARIARAGFAPISAAYGHGLLDCAMASPFPALAASPFYQQTLDENSAAGTLHPLLSHLASTLSARRGRSAASKAADLIRELKGLNPSARLNKAKALITQLTATTLGLSAGAALDNEISFKDLGIDSLMSLALRNHINLAFGLRLPATLIYDCPTPQLLATHVVASLFPQSENHHHAPDNNPPTLSEAQIRAMIGSIPIARLREEGILDALIALSASVAPANDAAHLKTMQEIQSASIDELLALANSEMMETRH